MKAFLISVLAILLAAGGSVFVREVQTQSRLRAEVARLQRQCHDLGRLRREHQRQVAASVSVDELGKLRSDQRELERLRATLASLNGRIAAQDGIRAASGSAKPLQPGMTALTDLTEAGTSTPAAAEQTFFWALAQIDPDLLAKQLVLAADARANAEKLLASLDDETRAKMGTPERLMGYYLVGLLGRVSGVQMLAQQADGPDQATWTAKLQMISGRINDYDFTVRRDGDTWREEIPAGMVDQWSRYLVPHHATR